MTLPCPVQSKKFSEWLLSVPVRGADLLELDLVDSHVKRLQDVMLFVLSDPNASASCERSCSKGAQW